MDLKGVFLKACKKEDVVRVADYVVRNPDSLSVLVQLMLDNKKAYSHRAGWALNTLMARNPIDLSAYTEQLLALFISDKVLNSSTRNLLHIFRSIDFNEVHQSSVETLRLSVDESKTFVKYEVNVITASYEEYYEDFENEGQFITASFEAGTYGRPSIYDEAYTEYEHADILTLLATEEWTSEETPE